MHKNPYWLALVVAIALVVGWYSLSATLQIYRYLRLNSQATATVTQWTVKEINDQEYRLQAHYTFNSENKNFSGETILTEARYWNAYAAERSMPQYAAQRWIAFYQSNYPENSTLQKSFPLKECVSAAVLWGILFYFAWLGRYVKQFQA